MRHLSYANVVSSVAVFLALGGVAWAAKTLPKNSVGAKQIKADAVTTAKVGDGKLTAADFVAGSLRGAPGAKGPAGDPGPEGPAGDAGGKGATGDSCADLRCSSSDIEGTVDITADSQAIAEDLPAFKTWCEEKRCRVMVAGSLAATAQLNAWFKQAPFPTKRSASITSFTFGGDPWMRFHMTNAHPVAVERFGNRVQVTLAMEFLQRVAV